MSTKALAGLALLTALFGVHSVAISQGRPIELGQDAGIAVNFNGGTLTEVSVPTGGIRAGFFVGDQFSIEPELALTYITSGGESVTVITAFLSGLFHFTPDRTRAQPFFRPAVGIVFVDSFGSASQFSAGGAFGVKLPLAERIAARLEAAFVHSFENGDFAGRNTLGVTFGFSFFTR